MSAIEQRKLAAIMFTDMVGFSALSQRSEALALELLEEHRRIVRGILPHHSGREVKTTGDGFLIEFPSALAAVQCAVEIQNAFHERNQTSPPERQLRLRIGIHVGDVVMREGDIHGDGVNIAARLEPLAPAGGICVSNAVHEQVRNKLEQSFASLGPAELKNIELPVAVHRVVMPWEGPGAGKLPGLRRHGTPNIWKIILPVCAVVVGIVVIVWQPWRKSGPVGTDQPAPLSEARQLIVKARHLFEREDDSNRENLLLADELLTRAEGLDPTDGEIWAAHAQLSGLFISLAYDSGNARHAAVRAQAERAMKLAPDSVESRLAKAWYLTSQPNTLAEGETVLTDLIRRAPNDWRPLRIMGHTARRLGRFDEGLMWLDRAAAFPEGTAVAKMEKATVLFNQGRIPEAETALEESLKVRPLGRSLLLKVNGLTLWEGDLDAAKQTLEQISPSLMLEDRGAFLAFRVWLWRREPAKCLAVLNGVSRDFLEDQYFQGPKAFLVAATQKLAGRPDAARPEWEQALRLIEERLRGNPSQTRLLCEKALCLIELDKPVEAEAALRACQQEGKCETQMWPGGGVAGVLLKLGRPAAALDEIAARIADGTALYNTRAVLELNPDFDPLRNDPRFQQILSKAPGPIRPAASAVAPDQKSIAVLAFDNLSRDPDNAYFCEGVQDEILTRLAKVADLKVISRTSTQKYKSAPDNLREIAKQLGVMHVVEGSVQKASDQVRVNVQLINATTDAHLWAETFDRKLTDLFAVETEIAKTIAETLQAKLTGSEKVLMAKKPTENPAAYELYLKGRFFWNKRTAANLRKAIEYFNQAIEQDPLYARAYAGLADSYAILSVFGAAAPQDSIPQARAAAKKALELDDTLAEAHASVGRILTGYDFDFPRAIAEFERAIALDPNYATAHHWLGWGPLSALGQFDRAIMEGKRAVELDPLSSIDNADLGLIYIHARRYDDAIAQLRKTIELDPYFYVAPYYLGIAFQLNGQVPEAISAYQKAAELNDDPENLAYLGQAYARTGRRSDAQTILVRLTQQAKSRYVSAYSLAVLLLALGEKDRAMDELERAYREGAGNDIFTIKIDPVLDDLRGQPRFEALVQKIFAANR